MLSIQTFAPHKFANHNFIFWNRTKHCFIILDQILHSIATESQTNLPSSGIFFSFFQFFQAICFSCSLWIWNTKVLRRGSRILVRGAQWSFDPKEGPQPKMCSK